MKYPYLKSINFRLVICCIILLGIAFIINSCKKDNSKSQSTITDAAVSQARAWYESTYPPASKYSITRANNSNLHGGNGIFNYSAFIKPDWQHGATYNRFNAAVVELPIDASSAQIGTGLGYLPNSNLYKAAYSTSSFLILNDSTGYHAYIMTIIADSAYVGNDLSKLHRNKYNRRDADFSGAVLYYSPDGNYVNGWIYKNGNIVWALPPNHGQNGPVAVNTSKANTSRAIKTGNFANNPRMLEVETCYTWYQTVTANGVTYGPTVLDEVCTFDYIDDGGGGSGGSSGSTGTSGSTGGGTTSTPPPPPPPCAVPSSSSADAVLPSNNHILTRVAEPVGGFPPPTSTTNPCTEKTTTTTTAQKDTIGSLMKNPNSLSQMQKDSLQAVLNKIVSDCIGQAIYNYFMQNSVAFGFLITPSSSYPAFYNAATGNITIQNLTSLTSAALEEEFFHAYQNLNIQGGILQYAGKSGDANIEFEAKLLRDIDYYINPTPQGNQPAVNSPAYTNFIQTITNNFTSFPTSFTSSELSTYFTLMTQFIQDTPGYSNDIINTTLNPTAMFKLINSSPCSE